ncbi:MAG: sugar ABC transporter permease, partial [Treponema sp.]|nr:sugar ABC transporter permease [Treponema sp.]
MKKNAVKVKLSLLSSENLQGWLFVLPVMIPLLMFWIFPVLNSFLISFTDWDLISNHFNIVFFKNYRSLFRDPKFYQVLRNSLVFAVGTTIPTILLGFLVALLFTEKMPIYGFFRTIIFSPYVTPMVAVSIVWSWIFEPRVGILNFVLSLLHLP